MEIAQAARRRASKSFDDVPHRLQLSSYPTDRLRDRNGGLPRLSAKGADSVAHAPSRKPWQAVSIGHYQRSLV